MDDKTSEKPQPPELPAYLGDPLKRQPPDRLEAIAAYAVDLADWKRQQRTNELDRRRATEAVDETDREELDERGLSTDPADYEDVPASGAYITVKTTKQTDDRSYDYYYWQWRDGDTWKNKYIAPVDPKDN